MIEIGQDIKKIEVEAVVTRSDGSVEDLGKIVDYDRDNPKKGKSRFRKLFFRR